MNLKFRHYICKGLPIFPILSQKNPDYVLPLNLFKIHFNITLPFTPKSSTKSLSFRFPHVKIVRFSLLSRACKRPGPRRVALSNPVNFSCEELSTFFQLQVGGPPLDDGLWLLI